MQNLFKTIKKITALITIVTFSATNFSYAQEMSFAAAQPEVSLPPALGLAQAARIQVPEKIATVDLFHDGQAKTIFHIQNAHGNYQGEKQTEALLQFLKEKYGVETILAEGAWNKLNPELIRFDSNAKKNADILDKLTKNAIVKGFETHLLASPGSTGYGIEEKALYNQGLKAFAEVQIGTSKYSKELAALSTQLEARQTKVFSADLRALVKRIEKYCLNQIPFENYLQELKALTQKHFRLDLADATLQALYPQLVRIYKIGEIEKKINSVAFVQEKTVFLNAIKRYTDDASRISHLDSLHASRTTIFDEVKNLLNLKDLSANLPDPATAEFFINLVRQLPPNFNYEKFKNVTSFFGLLILRSEIHADRLMQEIERLETELMNQLAVTEEAKALVKELKDYWLFEKLIALELTPSEFEGDEFFKKPIIF